MPGFAERSSGIPGGEFSGDAPNKVVWVTPPSPLLELPPLSNPLLLLDSSPSSSLLRSRAWNYLTIQSNHPRSSDSLWSKLLLWASNKRATNER